MKNYRRKFVNLAIASTLAIFGTSYAGDEGKHLGDTINVTESFDVGNVAVIVGNSDIIQDAIPDTPMDIVPGTQLLFHPTSSGAQTTYEVSRTTGSLEPVGPGSVTLGLNDAGSSAGADDGYSKFPADIKDPLDENAPPTVVPLNNSITYFGQTYDHIFVTSDGEVTFGRGDGRTLTRNYGRIVYGPPAIAPLLTDLSPDSPAPDAPYKCKGDVTAEQLADKVVVTWTNVVHYQRVAVNEDVCLPGTPVETSTFQVVIFTDNSARAGDIVMNYGVLDSDMIGAPEGGNREGVIGIAAGTGQAPLHRVDFSSLTTTSLESGAIFQEFTRQRAESIDYIQLAREFYKTHDDKFNFLAFARNFPAVGFNSPTGASHRTTGLGYATIINEDAGLYGSAGKLNNITGAVGNLNTFVDHNIEGLTKGKIVKNICFNVDPSKTVPEDDFLQSFLCLPEYGNKMNVERYGFVDDTGGKFSHDGVLYGYVTEDQSTDPLKLVIGDDYSLASRMGGFSRSIFSYYEPSLTDPHFAILNEIYFNFNFFYNNRVPNGQFNDGVAHVGAKGGAAIVRIDSVNGDIIDLDNPMRKIKDPTGKVAAAVASCKQHGYDTFMTERDMQYGGYSELEQYIMGIRNSEDISDSFAVYPAYSPILSNGSGGLQRLDGYTNFPFGFRRYEAIDDLTYCGNHLPINIVSDLFEDGTSAYYNSLYNDVNLAPSPRRAPAIGDEQDTYANGGAISGGENTELCGSDSIAEPGRDQAKCVDVKTMAFILLVKPDTQLSAKEIELVDTFRKAWDIYGNGPAVGGIGARGCQAGFSGVHNQCYDPMKGEMVPAKNKTGTPDYIPKFDTSLDPKIY